MDTEYIKNQVRDIVDFPTKGVVFKDLTTVLKNAEALKMISDELYDRYKNSGITKVVGIECRICPYPQTGQTSCSHVERKLQQGIRKRHDRNTPRRH